MALGDLGVRVAGRLTGEARRRLITRRLRAGDALKPGPSWVQVGIDERCNFRCGMCWAHSHRLPEQHRSHVLPRETFDHLVDQLRELGTQRLDIAGTGEPLLHPDALHMLRCVKAAGMECVLITNGSLLTPERCDALIETRLDSLNVSLNSATDEAHHRVSDAPVGQRSRIVDALRYLVASRHRRGATKPCISVSFIVQRDNCGEIRRFAQEAIDFGFDSVEFAWLGINEASRALVLSPEDAEEARRQMQDAQHMLAEAGLMTNARRCLSRARGPEWSKTVFRLMPCYVGHFFCRVLADGAVDPCGASRRVVGNVTRDRVRDVWSSLAYRTFRREAFALPNLGRHLDQCGCYTCGHAQRAFEYHEKLRAGLFPEIVPSAPRRPAVPPSPAREPGLVLHC